jgi:ABC-2 type transport system permease protein
MRLLAACFRRDLADDLSYRLTFIIELLDTLVLLAGVFLFSRGLGLARTSGYAPFPFLFVGLAVNTALTTCLVSFASSIRGSRAHGTLRALMLAPAPPAAQVLASAAYPFFRGTLDAGLHVLMAVLFGLSLSQANVPGALLVFLLALAAASSIGIAAGAFAVVFKRGDPLLWLVGVVSLMLGGVFYPVDMLPPALAAVAWITPIAPALAAMRPLLLDGVPIQAVATPVIVLALYGAIGVPASLLLLNTAVRHARRRGTIKDT